MSEIIVRELFTSAFSESKAIVLREAIQEKLDKGEKVVLDFSGISKFTTLFFNFSTGYFVSVLGPEEYNNKISLIGLSELGESTYKSSYENAMDKYNPDKHAEILEIIKNPEE